MSVEVLNESGYRVDVRELLGAVRHVIEELRVHPRAELCLRLVDEGTMSTLHQQWMDLEGPTDVMSFPMDELRPGRGDRPPEPGTLGDIVVCPAVAERQAREAGHAFEDELLLLVVHGMLHLLGFDHGTYAEEQEMFALQRTLLLTYLAEQGRASSTAPDSAQTRASEARAEDATEARAQGSTESPTEGEQPS